MIRIALLLLAVAGCKQVTSRMSDDIDAGTVTANLDGSWVISRTISSSMPQSPRTAPCPNVIVSFAPTVLTIAGTTLQTNGTRAAGNVQFFGAHALSFSESEQWDSVEGTIEFAVLYYDLDQPSSFELRGSGAAIGNWFDGPCAYRWTITAQLH